MKTFRFWIKRSWKSQFEKINIDARDSTEAIGMLPQCVAWQFRIND